VKASGALARDQAQLGFAQALAGLQQGGYALRLPARELVDRPGRYGRLGQPLHLIGGVFVAALLELRRQFVPGGDEVAQRLRVELI